MNQRTELPADPSAAAPAAQPAPGAPPADGKAAENEPGNNGRGAARKSLRETVRAASAEVAAREAAPVTETESAARVLRGEPEYPDPKAQKPAEAAAKPAAKDPAPKPAEPAKPAADPARDPETGKFRSASGDPAKPAPEADGKPAEPAAEPAKQPPPTRFSKEAQAEWDRTPEPVRKEVERALGELENGFRTYKARADKYAPIEQFEALGQRYGMTVPQVLADYAGKSDMMSKGPDGALKVFQSLAQRHGIPLQDLAAKVLDEELDDYVSRTSGETAALQKQVADLKRDLAAAQGQLAGFANQRRDSIMQDVEKFASAHPRFEELFPTIKWILATNGVDKSDPQKALSEAYDMADRLKPAPSLAPQAAAQPAAPAAQPKPDLTAQTEVALKSVHGSPGPGSNPSVRKPAKSVRDAVRTAAGTTGIA